MAAQEGMRAWLYSSAKGGLAKNLQLHNDAHQPPQQIKPTQIRLKVLSMSVNHADALVPELAGLASRAIISLPASPGMDFCGTVLSTGSSVSQFKEGDVVFGKLEWPSKFGPLGEIMIAAEKCIAHKPDAVSVDAAATIGVAGLTAYQYIAPNVKAGDKIFINGGSGGTGTFGIQIAKALGCHVTVSCSTSNIDFVNALGADDVVDYKTSDVVSSLKLKAQVQKGPVYSLIVDNVGTPSNLYKESHRFLTADGKFVQIASGADIGAATGLAGRMLLPGFLGGGKRKFQFAYASAKRDDFDQIAAWMAEGKVKASIEQAFEFEEAPAAYARLKTGRTRGKIVVHVGKR